jgi:hypothetical protein
MVPSKSQSLPPTKEEPRDLLSEYQRLLLREIGGVEEIARLNAEGCKCTKPEFRGYDSPPARVPDWRNRSKFLSRVEHSEGLYPTPETVPLSSVEVAVTDKSGDVTRARVSLDAKGQIKAKVSTRAKKTPAAGEKTKGERAIRGDKDDVS